MKTNARKINDIFHSFIVLQKPKYQRYLSFEVFFDYVSEILRTEQSWNKFLSPFKCWDTNSVHFTSTLSSLICLILFQNTPLSFLFFSMLPLSVARCFLRVTVCVSINNISVLLPEASWKWKTRDVQTWKTKPPTKTSFLVQCYPTVTLTFFPFFICILKG